ncbi:phosphoglycolate phosphatase [Aestuariirhabdus litorea]|uniref:Phosphoglycolate phosphatase n=2 Tax=Aestuariirhabdus litorea TaxID=2528527 RepID=A0A3P3VLA9_9GAMM|nr:phosphoglycolate phosphatase [Aestuariirhabdus litorea]RRJ83542.1 phosphoglycolate phosphatase [Aestuariirhabdus litorea]RWW93708.1 phosphoglycolate phosphatase [Endozoicomonadaceae bacterium GTF-13]
MRSLFGGQLPAAVIYDLDGTLVDSVPDLHSAVERFQQQLGLPTASECEVRDWVGNGAARLVERALAASAGERAEALFPAAMEAFMVAYADTNGRRARLYEGVRPVLEALAAEGVPQALVTNKPLAFTHPLLEKLGIASYFSPVLGGDSLPAKKPDPAPLRAVAETLGVAPERCLMVGDSRNDLLAARAAGMPVACVSYGYNHGEPIAVSCPDLLVDSLLKLL